MIVRRQGLRISVAIVASLGVHLAAAMVMAPPGHKVEIEGGTTPELAVLGSSFEDLLAGSAAAHPAEATPVEIAKPVAQSVPTPPTETPAQPQKTAAARPVEAMEPPKPVQVARTEVTPAAASRPVEAPRKPAPVSETKPAPASAGIPAKADAKAVPSAVEAASLPQTEPSATAPALPKAADAVTTAPAPMRPAETVPATQAPASATQPIETAALTPANAAETIAAEPEQRPIPIPVARPPQPRDERNLAEAREVQKEQAAKKKEPVKRQQVANVARGNADRNARAGDASGRDNAKAKSGGSDSGGKASRAGNAKASNYAGKVYAKIRRTRQKRAGGAGVARIGFSISSGGGLSSVRVASSSGSDAVDSAALDHVRRSAPFPPPPAGAQRQFIIPIEVRR